LGSHPPTGILVAMALQAIVRFPTAWSSADQAWAVHLFQGNLSVADMDRMQQIGDRWSAENPAKRVELVIVYPSDARMSSEERARMARLMKHGESRRTASATVILAEGLRGSMQRSTLTALLMLATVSHPAKVFGKVSDAVRWLFPHVQALTGGYSAPEQLEAELSAHLEEFRVRPPA
jgi:hypothetical protein